VRLGTVRCPRLSELIADFIGAALECGPLLRGEFASPGVLILFGIGHGGASLAGSGTMPEGIDRGGP
jgi:hypothetical protein